MPPWQTCQQHAIAASGPAGTVAPSHRRIIRVGGGQHLGHRRRQDDQVGAPCKRRLVRLWLGDVSHHSGAAQLRGLLGPPDQRHDLKLLGPLPQLLNDLLACSGTWRAGGTVAVRSGGGGAAGGAVQSAVRLEPEVITAPCPCSETEWALCKPDTPTVGSPVRPTAPVTNTRFMPSIGRRSLCPGYESECNVHSPRLGTAAAAAARAALHGLDAPCSSSWRVGYHS